MSKRNVELIRRACATFNRRDLSAFLALMDPDVEAVPRLVAIEGGYRGHDGIRRWWANLLDVIPDFTVEVVEVRDRGDLTIAILHAGGHPPGSDMSIREKLWHVAEWKHAMIVWWSIHSSEAEALEAVRLREPAGD